MSIRLDLYKIFDQVARSQSFSKGAEKLYMSQPAVSQAIRQLENELGVMLFTRTPKGVTLTNEGRVLLEYTSSALNLLGAGEQKLKNTHSLKEGELKIGATDTICRHYLLPFLERFSTTYPGIKLKILNRTTGELCNLVKSGEISLGVCSLPVEERGLTTIQCKEISDVFLGNRKYLHLINTPLDFAELMEFPLIFLDVQSSSRRYVEEFILSQGYRLQPEIELGSHDLLLDIAKIGLGICCAIAEFAESYLTNDELFEFELKTPIPKRAIGICYLEGVSLSPAALKLIDLLVE